MCNGQGGNYFSKKSNQGHSILNGEVASEDFPVVNVIYTAGYLLILDFDISDRAELCALLCRFDTSDMLYTI